MKLITLVLISLTKGKPAALENPAPRMKVVRLALGSLISANPEFSVSPAAGWRNELQLQISVQCHAVGLPVEPKLQGQYPIDREVFRPAVPYAQLEEGH